MKHKLIFLTSCLTLAALVFTNFAWADDAQLLDMVKGLQKQMSGMQRTIDSQNQKIASLENRQPSAAVASSGDSAAAPMSDYEFNQRLESSLGGANKWLKDLSFKGDFRLRYEAFDANSGNANESDPRNRFRYRLRYGFEKKLNEEMLVGFSMASGEANASNGFNTDPTSTNQTLTNDFTFKNIWIEKAYATYMPNWAKVGPISKLTITGGKFDNPFEKGSSDIIWDRDVKPEGIIEKADFNVFSNEDVALTGWLTGGQMPVRENGTHASGSSDATLFAEQLGFNTVLYTPLTERPIEHNIAASMYHWNRYAKDSNFSGTGTSLARGNSNATGNAADLDVAGFQVFELYNELALYPIGKTPFRPYADFARNFQGDNPEGATGTGDLNAWALGLKVGSIVKQKDWEVSYAFKYIGANAVPGFNDSDFGYAGHSGHAGSVFKAGYALTDSLTLNLAAFFVRNLNADTNGIVDQQEKRFQTDLVWKF